MPSRNMAGSLGLNGDWDLGEDGWKDGVDENWLRLSVLVQPRAISLVSATPGTPTEGDVYLFDDTHPTEAGKIAVYDEAEWVYITPATGWLCYDAGASTMRRFNGTTWAAWPESAGAVYAPVEAKTGTTYTVLAADVGKYLRFTNTSAKTVTVAPNSTEALPSNGEWHIRNVGATDLTLTPGSGVTINVPSGGSLVVPTGGTVTLKRAAADVFDLIGQTVLA